MDNIAAEMNDISNLKRPVGMVHHLFTKTREVDGTTDRLQGRGHRPASRASRIEERREEGMDVAIERHQVSVPLSAGVVWILY